MNGMVSSNGVNHLAMATGDMDKTVRSWRDLLGMRLVAGLGQPGYRHYFFQISDTDLVAFFEWPGVEPVVKKEHGRPVKGPFIFDHVSFGVQTEDDLWQLKDRLEAAGFPVSDVVDHGFIHSIYAHDPNGIPIEFSHNVEAVNIRKEPQMRDKAPSRITLEGAEPQKGMWPEVTMATPQAERVVYPGAGSELFHGKKVFRNGSLVMGKVRILSHSLFVACIIVKEPYTKIQTIMIGANSLASSFRKSIFLRRHRSCRSLKATGRIPVYESIH